MATALKHPFCHIRNIRQMDIKGGGKNEGSLFPV